MKHRGLLRISHLSLPLILLCSQPKAGDFVISLVKSAGKAIVENGFKIAGAAAAAKTINYTSQSFDPNTGTFDLSGGRSDIPCTITENRGLPTGVQMPSSSYTEMPVIDPSTGRPASRQVSEKILHQQYLDYRENKVKQEAMASSLKQLDEQIISHEQYLRKDRKEFEKNKNRDSSWNEAAKQHEVDLANLKAEKASRKPKQETFPYLMSDEDLDKNIRNLSEKLEDAKAVYAEASKPEWWGKKNEARVEKGQVDTITRMLDRVKAEKESRLQKKVVNTVSTAMVMNTQTVGVTGCGSKMEKVPQKGDKLPVYEPEIVNKVPKVISTELTGGGKGPDKDPENEKINKIIATATVGTAVEEGVRHALTPAEKAERKAELAKMNQDRQPFHEKGIEAEFQENPGQRLHNIGDRAGHFKEFNENVKVAVKDSIKAEHFDYVDVNGNSRYTREVNGKQVWVEVRPNGKIKNFGANETFWQKDPVTGLRTKPAGADKDKGVFFTMGAGAIGSSMTEVQSMDRSTERLMKRTMDQIEKQAGIKLSGVPDISSDSPLKLKMTPELQKYGELKTKEFMSKTPQQQIQSILNPPQSVIKPLNLPGVNPLPSRTSVSSQPVLRSTSTPSVPTPPAPRPSAPTVLRPTSRGSGPITVTNGHSRSSSVSAPRSMPTPPRPPSSSGRGSSRSSFTVTNGKRN